MFAARIRRRNISRVRAGVPSIDCVVKLHSRIAALPRGFRNGMQQVIRRKGVHRRAGRDGACLPQVIVRAGAHEGV